MERTTSVIIAFGDEKNTCALAIVSTGPYAPWGTIGRRYVSARCAICFASLMPPVYAMSNIT